MKLFDDEKLAKIRKKITAWIATFVSLSLFLLTAAILSAVFYKHIGRAGAQTISTVCVIIVACFALIFADYVIRYKKLSMLCKADKVTMTACVKSVSKHNVTYRALPFVQVEVITEDNEERNIYLYEGLLQTDVWYKFDIANNIICGYEEIQ